MAENKKIDNPQTWPTTTPPSGDSVVQVQYSADKRM